MVFTKEWNVYGLLDNDVLRRLYCYYLPLYHYHFKYYFDRKETKRCMII